MPASRNRCSSSTAQQTRGQRYISSIRAGFFNHIDFVQRTYLSIQPTEALEDANSSKDNHRFAFGPVVRYSGLDRYGVEFWEGDVLNGNLLRSTCALIGPAFPAQPAFKANCAAQLMLVQALKHLPKIDARRGLGIRMVKAKRRTSNGC